MPSASARLNARAAAIPAKPPPTITTRFRFVGAASGRDKGSGEGVSLRATVIWSPYAFGRRVLSLADASSSSRLGSCFLGGCLLGLGAQLEQPQQDLVAL